MSNKYHTSVVYYVMYVKINSLVRISYHVADKRGIACAVTSVE
jgi:hypothetical protein